MPTYYSHHEEIVQACLKKLGKNIVMGIPLGIGKPLGIVNAFYLAACADPTINLTIFTGLTLSRPLYKNALEKNFIEPYLDRILGNYEDPLYEAPRIRQQLPKNINIIEFFLSPGKYLHNNYVQQNYINSSYTNVIRDCLTYPINILATQVAPSSSDKTVFSLSANSDLFPDLITEVQPKVTNKSLLILAEVNANLPFMYGDAVVQENAFTDIVDTKHYPHLFALPSAELTPQDHMIGLYVSTLVKDNGCIQLGIGKMSNAVTESLLLKHENNNAYQEILTRTGILNKFSKEIALSGDTGPFTKGLYASTEMMSDGYLHLLDKNILKKKVYDDIELQRIANDDPNAEILKDKHGILMHAGFFVGSNDFYNRLRALPENILRSINMTTISRTNSLLQNPALYKLQRRSARFINSAMMVTLGGVLISDGLSNLQEVSGVGGQFDFVDMASNLDDSRSIVTCPATRKAKTKTVSNIIWNYTNFTIPRYLRDVVITEYGIADCRSKTDEDIIKTILNIADSRFQSELLQQAKSAGKIASNYQIPEQFRYNFPEQINENLKVCENYNFGKAFPFGTEMTNVEIKLQRALLDLKGSSVLRLLSLFFKSIFVSRNKYREELVRMQLWHPKSLREFIYSRVVIGAVIVT